MTPVHLRAHALSKRYGRKPVLSTVDFSLDRGVYGLLGPNGAGKTTLIRILATVMPPTEGTVSYDGDRFPGAEHLMRRRLGYLPQLYGLYDHMTGREFLE
jgi:ABC-2 type transport system ATP-binding protein